VETLAVRKKEFEAFDERVHALTSAVGDAETRMEAIAAKDKGVAALSQKVDAISTRFETLFAQADDLTKKQLSLETLHERLAEVDDLAKQTALQMNGLKESRQDLEALRKDVQDFYKSHGEIAQLRDRLGADRLALEAFGDRMTAMATRAPELEAKMEAILGKM